MIDEYCFRGVAWEKKKWKTVFYQRVYKQISHL